MRTYILFFLAVCCLSCAAQSPIIDMSTNPRPDIPDGAYLKDVSQDLNKYVGTWIWQEGNKRFEMNLQKLEMVPNFGFYSDCIIGTYKYEVDGVILENNLGNTYVNYFEYPVLLSFSSSMDARAMLHDNSGLRGVGFFLLDETVNPVEMTYDISPHGSKSVYSSQQEYDNRPKEYLFPLRSDTVIRLIKQ